MVISPNGVYSNNPDTTEEWPITPPHSYTSMIQKLTLSDPESTDLLMVIFKMNDKEKRGYKERKNKKMKKKHEEMTEEEKEKETQNEKKSKNKGRREGGEENGDRKKWRGR
jgi:hypothetical protein